jgi:hypothetical protein
VAVLRCPAAISAEQQIVIDTSFTYESSSGPVVAILGRPEKDLGLSNYVGVSGAYGNTPTGKQLAGVFVKRQARRIPQILDGTSKTLMLGENAAAIGWIGAAGWPASPMEKSSGTDAGRPSSSLRHVPAGSIAACSATTQDARSRSGLVERRQVSAGRTADRAHCG